MWLEKAKSITHFIWSFTIYVIVKRQEVKIKQFKQPKGGSVATDCGWLKRLIFNFLAFNYFPNDKF